MKHFFAEKAPRTENGPKTGLKKASSEGGVPGGLGEPGGVGDPGRLEEGENGWFRPIGRGDSGTTGKGKGGGTAGPED